MPPTPTHSWPLLAARTGTDIRVKHENHTPTGAFKVRGGLIHMRELKAAHPGAVGVIAATRGNHGQAVAFAARAHGITATIVVPEGNSVEKNAAMQAFGAELIVHGHDFQEALEYAEGLAEARDLIMVPSFGETLVTAGTISAEDLDLFMVRDEPRAVVDAIFDYYEHKSFEPSAQEQEKLLEL